MATITAKRYGHFYETLGADAETVSTICGLTLTRQRITNAPACGFPIWGDIEGIRADLAKAGFALNLVD